MKKIENVIENCQQCRFKKESKIDKTIYKMCTKVKDNHFLLSQTEVIGKEQIGIPENCPLETYNDENKP